MKRLNFSVYSRLKKGPVKANSCKIIKCKVKNSFIALATKQYTAGNGELLFEFQFILWLNLPTYLNVSFKCSRLYKIWISYNSRETITFISMCNGIINSSIQLRKERELKIDPMPKFILSKPLLTQPIKRDGIPIRKVNYEKRSFKYSMKNW